MSLIVTRALGLVTVQDLGRPGHMHEALPPGGALVRARLLAANRAAQNPDTAPALEIMGRLTVRAEHDLVIGLDRGGARVLAAGEELTVESEPWRVAYLAVRGGIDAPLVLGGRGAHLSARIGARVGAGDRIATAAAPRVGAEPDAAAIVQPAAEPRIRVIAGPDLDAFAADALAILTGAAYRIAPTSDRVGTRLEGPSVPRSRRPEVTRPMVIGAIEVPRDGQPIVLGPEHPTTGGYPVIGVIAHADLGRFFAIRLGGTVRLAIAGPSAG